MQARLTLSFRLLAVLCVISSDGYAEAPDFRSDIAPLLNKYCVGCHNHDDAEGKLSLESFASLQQGGESGPALMPGDSAASRLIRVLTGVTEPAMPPEDEPAPAKDELATLIAWINTGANGPEGVAPGHKQLMTPKLAPSKAAKPITSVAFSPDGHMLAVARFGHVALRWADGQRHIARLAEHPGKVNAVSFSGDGSRLLTATGITGLYGQAMVWDVTSGELLKTFEGHRDTLYGAVFSPDGRHLATASYDHQIIVWEAESGRQLRTLKGHNGAVYDLAFSPNGDVLASASGDATIKIWHVDSGQRLDTLSQPLKEQYSVDIGPDGRFVIAAGEDNRIRMWRLISTDKPRINPLVHARFAHEGAIQRVRFSQDGKLVVSAAADNTVKIWRANGLSQLQVYEAQSDSTQAVAVSPNGQHLAVGRMDGSLEVYPVRFSSEQETVDSAHELAARVRESDTAYETSESEPNDLPAQATRIELPARISGTVHANADTSSDHDFYRFTAKAGETWMVEIQATRDDSPLDSHVAVLSGDGQPIPRVQLRAVRDSYFTFRGKDSMQTGDFRLHNWREMKLNQYLYASGEVVKLYHYPRGPDSGFNVYPNFGNRHGHFDTTPLAHALHEPCYIVEAYPPGTELPPNGLPVFVLHYENDDESQRRLGRDSQLTFVAPTDSDYLVRVTDVRGFHGEDFKYQLLIRPPKPDFRVKITGQNPTVPPGAGRKFGFEVERIDGFDGPIQLQISDLPDGFSASTPIVVEPGQQRAWGTIIASSDAKKPEGEDAKQSEVIAAAIVNGKDVRREVGSLGEIKLGDVPTLIVQLNSDQPTSGSDPPGIEIRPGETTTATIRIERRGHEGRVGFGSEEAAINVPHGVYVDNIGLNGVLIVEGQDQRQFFLTAEPWVEPTERLIFVEADSADKPTSQPVVLRVLPR